MQAEKKSTLLGLRVPSQWTEEVINCKLKLLKATIKGKKKKPTARHKGHIRSLWRYRIIISKQVSTHLVVGVWKSFPMASPMI